ncbi:MAG: hypothetical protein WBF58_21165 [Xanthobacteraceae bacterium]
MAFLVRVKECLEEPARLVLDLCFPIRHGRACPGHPRLILLTKKDVDARDKRGHDDAEVIA